MIALIIDARPGNPRVPSDRSASTLGAAQHAAPGPPGGRTQRPLLPNVSEAGGGQGSPSPESCLARPVSRRKGGRTAAARRVGPLRHAAHASRPDPRVGHIHSSRCRTTRPGVTPGDAPAGRAGGEFSMDADGPGGLGRRGRSGDRSTVCSPIAGAMVEQDGIEPTTSCLQSTRSTD